MSTGPVDLGELAAAWWEYQRLTKGSRPERKALELGEHRWDGGAVRGGRVGGALAFGLSTTKC